MSEFNYVPTNYTGTERYVRLVKPLTKEVWEKTGGAFVAESLVPGTHTQANTSVAITFSAGLRGYPIDIATLFPSLKSGDYDLQFYNAAAAASAVSDPIEQGFGFFWNGSVMLPPREKLVNRVG